jgi:hypothetical protein
VLFPTQLPAGPRIADTRTTTASVGGPVPIVFGTCAVAGTVIWLAPYVEHSSGGGKGGPVQKLYNYTQSIAIALCERVDDYAPDAEGAIGGVSRIWENGAIVYDIRPQQLASSTSLLNRLAETDQEYANRLTASAAYAETFTLYLGDEIQLPDPTIEAVQGAGNVPAFRGLAYIVYPNRNLTMAQGLRHPNFQFEVYAAGASNCVTTTLNSNEVLYPWAGGGLANDPVNPRNTHTFKIQGIDPSLAGWSTYNPATIYTSEADTLAALNAFGYGNGIQYIGYAYTTAGNYEIIQSGGTAVTDHIGGVPDPQEIQIAYNFAYPRDGFYSAADSTAGLIPVKNTPNALFRAGNGGGQLALNTGSLTFVPPLTPPWVRVAGSFGSAYWFFLSFDAQVEVRRFPSSPLPLCDGLPPSAIIGYSVMLDGKLIQCNPWTRVTLGSSTVKVLQQYAGANPSCTYPLDPCLLVGDPNYSNATFWTAAYTAAVTHGWMTAGKVYGVDYPMLQNFYWTVEQVICEASGATVSLAQIISKVCNRAGLTAIDVTDMESIDINGYPVAAVSTGSAIITPLRSVGFFDAVESEGTLKFLARGKPIVATLTADDFGAYDATASTDPSKCPPSVTTARMQDVELPRSIRLHYMATSRDYQDAEQDSEFRLATNATNDIDVTLPLCLDDTQALRCANVLWASAWAARNSHTLSVDQAWLNLDPADCIGVPIDAVIERLRIVSDTLASGVLRKLTCVRDSDGAYISFAVASAPAYLPAPLTFIAPASFEFLDLPCLQDADSDPGFYVAAQRLNGVGAWKGASIYKSIDGGATYTLVSTVINEAPLGVLGAAVPASQAFTWDDVTLIDVTVAAAAITFEGVSDAAVLAGANAAAMGSDGRWEIVQFGRATQIDPTHWQLSHLLRGRRGTEHVMGTSQPADKFVLVSGGDLGHVVLQSTEIGAARTYQVCSIGLAISSAVTQAFTGHGQALVCFSPVDATAQRQSDGDILLTWIRRSRLGRTLMSGIDIPLGEATEAFSIDIIELGSPHTVLRTLTSSTVSVLYSHANQETDFGSPLPATITVAIYQLSAITGRGTPLIATLPIS